jgi:hypothetical protein
MGADRLGFPVIVIEFSSFNVLRYTKKCTEQSKGFGIVIFVMLL